MARLPTRPRLRPTRAIIWERHLHEVIAWIERRSPVELLAIGIGHDVTRHYRRAVTLRDADDSAPPCSRSSSRGCSTSAPSACGSEDAPAASETAPR